MSEFKFCETDINKIKQEMTEDYEAYCGVKLYTGSANYLFLNWMAYFIWQSNIDTNEAAKQNLKKYAVGENLDAVIECIDGIKRNTIQAARAKFRFTLKDGENYQVIPAGTRITADNSVIFITEEDLIILAYEEPFGGGRIDWGEVWAVCTAGGVIGNDFAAGSVNKILDYIPKISGAFNIETTSGGTAEESDAEYYERSIEESKRISTAGPLDAYDSLAKTASGAVIDAKSFEGGANEIIIKLICDKTSRSAKETVADVEEFLTSKSVKPQTDLIRVEEAEAVCYEINAEYGIRTERESETAEILSAAETAVKKYIDWQDSKIGRALNPTQLISVLSEIGVSSVKVISPQYTLLKAGQRAEFNGKITLKYTGVHDD